MHSAQFRQEVINVVLAQQLNARGLVASPEVFLKRAAVDVLVSFRGLRLAIEGEVDDQAGAAERAWRKARERVQRGLAHVGLAVVYPSLLRGSPIADLPRGIAEGNLRFSFCLRVSPAPRAWQEGNLAFLRSALDEVFRHLSSENEIRVAAKLLTDCVERLAGDSTNFVNFEVGNAGNSQGQLAVQYQNAAASGGPQGRIVFFPRNNGGSSNFAGGLLTFEKVPGADTSKVTLTNEAGTSDASLVLNAAGNIAISAGGTNQSVVLTPTGTGAVKPRNLAANVNTVTFSATPTFDASLGNTQKITLTANVTSSTLSNATAGQALYFLICQDATGGRTFVWPTNVKGATTIGSTASTCTAQSFVFDGTNAYALAAGVINQ
jgi:hypothetical protein